MNKTEFNWMIGGPQGSGVDSVANIFGRAFGYGGFNIYGKREYHSNIKGMHSYFHIRVSDQQVQCNVDAVDLLVAFDAETVIRHFSEVVPRGAIICNQASLATIMMRIPTIPQEFKEEFGRYLKSKGIGETVNDLLEDAKKEGIKVFPVPYMKMLKEIAIELGDKKLARVTKIINVLGLGVSLGLLDYNQNLANRAIRTVFSDKPQVANINVIAHNKAYNYSKEKFGNALDINRKLRKPHLDQKRIFLSGNQAVALGKIFGGCTVQTYYPITPAADESEYLEAREILETKKGRGCVIVVQTEDEIAAINMASGAALSGARAATSTSGPGFSLMVEGLGWAGSNEVPLVITYYQRGAPSTGLPTRTGQDDLLFTVHASHGEFPRIILASGDIKECFYDTIRAFNYAEKYQMPVIHLIDKALANSSQSYPFFDVKEVRIERGTILTEDDLKKSEYRRFKFTESGVSPRVFLGTKGGIHWYTGDEHNEFGHISEEPLNRKLMMEKRMKKLATADKEIPVEERVSFFGNPEAKAVIVSWGSPKGAVLEAMRMLEGENYELGFLQVRMPHPLPREYFSKVLGKAEKRIDVEMNYSGQLASIIAEKTGIMMDNYILKYNGRPMSCTEVYTGLKNILTKKVPQRQVLTHGS